MRAKKKKSLDLWAFSPLVFLASAGTIALLITHGDMDFPYLLIGGITAVMYAWPKWREWPDSIHCAFMIGCGGITLAFALWYYVNNCLIIRKKNT